MAALVQSLLAEGESPALGANPQLKLGILPRGMTATRQAEGKMKLLKWFFEPGCAHNFTWPRLETTGRHYQVCLRCGAAYGYDWENMRRTKRLLTGAAQHLHPEPMPAVRVWQRALHAGH
jgi:hypothetical protein